jgi:hypothetical protein
MPVAITPDMIDATAKVCHEANRAWCELTQDFTQPHWEMAPDWQKNSARAGVRFHFSNPDSKPEDSHKEWFKAKEAEGWVYGDTKDTEAKRHPCMVPFEKLPKSQQMKDHIFHAVCHAMAKGYEIR